MNKTIEQMWQEYAAHAIHVGDPHIVKVLTKRTFYAGCFAMMIAIKTTAKAGVSEDEGVAYCISLECELIQFGKDVKEGKQ